MLRHFLRSNGCYLPSCLLPFFRLILASSFLPTHFLLLNYFYSSTKIRLLFAILIYFRNLLSTLHHFLRSNGCYLPSYLSPFFHLILANSFLPMRFLLLNCFYNSTKIRLLFAILIYFRSLLSMLRHFLRSNGCYPPSCLLPFFHLILASSFLPMRFLLLIHFYSSTMHHRFLPNHFEHVERVEHVVYIVHLIY